MAEQEKKVVSRIKTKKKSWYPLLAPPLFGGREIGETYQAAPEEALGIVLHVNLRDITGDLKDQNAYVRFKVSKVERNRLYADVVGYELTTASVKRLVRKNTTRLDDRFSFVLKDGNQVLVKTLLITLYHTQRSVQAKLRKQTRAFLAKELKEMDFSSFMQAVIVRKLTMELKKRLNKIFPLKEAALRVVALQEKGKESIPADLPEEEMPDPAEEESSEVSESPEAEQLLDENNEKMLGDGEAVSPFVEEEDETLAEA